MLVDSVDTIDDLRQYTCWADVVQVRGYWIAGDGGGGVFYRDPVSADLEDGGMVIRPAPQLPGRWKRLFESCVNVKWFGAKGVYEPLTDDTTPIQNAIDYLQRQMLNLGDGVTVKGAKLACSFTLYIPRGKYRITSTLRVPEHLGVRGDYDAMLVCDDPTVPILQIGSYYNNIQGLGFSGGLHHIIIPNPSTPSGGDHGVPINGEIVIRDCTFRYPAGPCIYQDPRISGKQSPINANLLVEDCDFQGACFFWGSFFPAIFQSCNLGVDLSSPPLDDGGKPLAVWNNGGILQVSDVRADPSNYTREHDGGWFQGTGFCHFTRMRFGGGNRLTGFRIRTSMTYKGLPLLLRENELACIYIRESGMYSFGEHNWMEIYEEFPAVIDVRSLRPSSLPEPYNYVTMVGTWGVWVDASVSMPAVAARQKSSTIIHLEGFQGVDIGGYPSSGFRFRQSSDPTTKEGVDLWPYLRQFMDSEPSPYANTLYPASDMHQNNLYFPGVFDLSQCIYSQDAVGIGPGQPDSSTGYTLSTYVSLQDGAWLLIDMGIHPETAAGWGVGLPAGEYVLSMYIKINWAGEVLLGRRDQKKSGAIPQFLAVRRLVQAGYYQRVWFSFYHDGSGKIFSLQINDWPKGGTLSVGLFAVHKGTTPVPYTFPVDNFVRPTANITMEEYVQESYRAMESPKAGTYKQGDIVYNANPQPGGYVGWICVQGTSVNTPAEWKAFGAISL